MLETISIIIAVVVPVVAAVTWLIQRGLTHQSELIEAKSSAQASKVSEIFEELRDVIARLTLIEREQLSGKIELKSVIRRLDDMMTDMKEHRKEMDAKITKMEKSTVTWLTDQLAIIKSKKG